MNDNLLDTRTLREGTWLERLAWMMMQLTGMSVLVAHARKQRAD